jgi:hypothetical protein
MSGLVNDVAEGLGVKTFRTAHRAGKAGKGTWVIEFSETQGDLVSVQFARVFDNPSGGGRILFDKGILFPAEIGSPQLAKLSLKARIQAILIHEIEEGKIATRLKLPPGQRIGDSHDLSLLTSPFSQVTKKAEREVAGYLRLWQKKGGHNPGVNTGPP